MKNLASIISNPKIPLVDTDYQTYRKTMQRLWEIETEVWFQVYLQVEIIIRKQFKGD